MKVSVAMATYNGSKFIEEQLASIVRQSRPPDEIVICDDNSGDGTVATIDQFIKSCELSIRLYVNDTNLGYAQNFSKALGLASGDMVFLADQDDVWFERKIQTILNVADKSPNKMIIMNDTEFCDSKLNRSGISKLQQLDRAGLDCSHYVMGCCAAIRRELLDNLLPVPSSLRSHDNWLVEMADMLGVKHIEPQVLQLYRQHGGNESSFFINDVGSSSLAQRCMRWVKGLSRRGFSSVSLQYELCFKQEMLNRLLARKEKIERFTKEDQLSDVINALQVEVETLIKRDEIHALPRFHRISAVARLARNGEYRGSRGSLRALKDLLIERTQP